MTDQERNEFEKLTRRPELRGLNTNDFSTVHLITVIAMALTFLGCAGAGVLLNNWRPVVLGMIGVVVILIIGASIDQWRQKRRR